jgi:predicted DNA-binding transcriptional regulator AlpA
MKTNEPIKAAITVKAMCDLLSMGRSQFYAHVRKGTFHQPKRLKNGRPYYDASQVEDNLRARELGVSVSGDYVLFYDREQTPSTPKATPASQPDHKELISGLQALGLSSVTTKQVAEAVVSCFPKGAANQDENEVLRTVFRHLKRAGIA